MTTDKPKDIIYSLAKIIAIIFHPLLMPVYGMAIIFIAPTLLGYLPFNVKKLLIFIMLVDNVLLPLSILPFLIQKKIITSWAISERKERNILLIFTTLLYCATSFIIIGSCVPEIIYYCNCLSFSYSYYNKLLVEDIASFCWSRCPNRSCAYFIIKNVDAPGWLPDFCNNCRRFHSFLEVET